MFKRSECGCICHTDAVALGMIAGPMHITPCCEPDDNLKADGGYCSKCGTVWASPGKCKCEPLFDKPSVLFPQLENTEDLKKETWNAAIEAAANRIEGAPMFAAEIRKLKR